MEPRRLIYAYVPDLDNPVPASIAASAIDLLFVAFLCLFWRQTRRKKTRLTQPLPNLPWAQTYSVVSLRLVSLVEASLVMNLLYCLYESVLFELQDEHFQKAYDFRVFLISPLFVLGDMIGCTQAFEWIIMTHIIQTQRYHSPDQILSQSISASKKRKQEEPLDNSLFNQVELSSKITSFEKSFLKSERRIKVIYTCFSVTVSFLQLFLYFAMAVFSSSETTLATFRYILLGYYLCSAVCEVIIFFRLVYLMRLMHQREYLSNRKSMILQIAWAVIYRLILIINLQLLLFETTEIKNTTQMLRSEVAKKLIQLAAVLKFYTIVHVKTSADVLSGVSKLDNLLKISIFQKFKYEDRASFRRHGLNIFSGNKSKAPSPFPTESALLTSSRGGTSNHFIRETNSIPSAIATAQFGEAAPHLNHSPSRFKEVEAALRNFKQESGSESDDE